MKENQPGNQKGNERMEGNNEDRKSLTPDHTHTKSNRQDPAMGVAVFFSTGDIGDVGRHVVAAALEISPQEIPLVKVFARNCHSLLSQKKWKCACLVDHDMNRRERDDHRVDLFDWNCSKDSIIEHLDGINVIITCLGNRDIRVVHPECIAHSSMEQIVQAATQRNIHRVIALSSVGISEDWPPMEWSEEGRRLEALFRTICWSQFQDLAGAEQVIRAHATANTDFDYLIVRSVLLRDTTIPCGSWTVQRSKCTDDHPLDDIAKMDCARFLVQQALHSSFHRCAITVGGQLPRSLSIQVKENI